MAAAVREKAAKQERAAASKQEAAAARRRALAAAAGLDDIRCGWHLLDWEAGVQMHRMACCALPENLCKKFQLLLLQDQLDG